MECLNDGSVAEGSHEMEVEKKQPVGSVRWSWSCWRQVGSEEKVPGTHQQPCRLDLPVANKMDFFKSVLTTVVGESDSPTTLSGAEAVSIKVTQLTFTPM